MNLSSILNGDRMTLNIDTCFESIELENEHGIRYLSPLNIKGIIRKKGDFMELDAHFQSEVAVSCGRCLQDVIFPVDMEAKVFLTSEDQRSWDDEYDSFLIEKDQVNLAELATLEILQQLPIQPLCDEDCLGLCPQCGANLNVEDCQCEEETDSRFDILKELLK